MSDTFQWHQNTMEGPAHNAFDITPSDGDDLDYVTRGLYVGITGDVKVDTANGDTVTFGNIIPGVVHPIRAKKVYSTGTTATSIIGLY